MSSQELLVVIVPDKLTNKRRVSGGAWIAPVPDAILTPSLLTSHDRSPSTRVSVALRIKLGETPVPPPAAGVFSSVKSEATAQQAITKKQSPAVNISRALPPCSADHPWDRRCVRRFLAGSSPGVVRSRRRRWSDRRGRRSYNRPADLGCCYGAAEFRSDLTASRKLSRGWNSRTRNPTPCRNTKRSRLRGGNSPSRACSRFARCTRSYSVDANVAACRGSRVANLPTQKKTPQ